MSSWDIAAPGSGEFRVGSVLANSLNVFADGILVYLPFGALSQLPRLILALRAAASTGMVPSRDPPGLILVDLLVQSLGWAVMISVAYEALSQQQPAIGEAVARGLSRFLSVLLTSTCAGLFIGLCTLLLVIPGLMATAALFVATSACVIEGAGPIQSLRRSAELTKGHRWQLSGLFLVVLLIALIAYGVPSVLMRGTAPAGVAIMRALLGSVVGAFNLVVTVAAYHGLRAAKEGVHSTRYASVFD